MKAPNASVWRLPSWFLFGEWWYEHVRLSYTLVHPSYDCGWRTLVKCFYTLFLYNFPDWMPHIVVPSCLHCKLVRSCAPNQCQQSPCEKLDSRVPPNRDCIWYIYVCVYTKIHKLALSEHHMNIISINLWCCFMFCSSCALQRVRPTDVGHSQNAGPCLATASF